MITKTVPVWAKPLLDKTMELDAKVDAHHTRIATLETIYNDVSDISTIVKKIWRAVKWGAPTMISAAVTAGYLNGDFAKLLKAVFS